MGKAPDLPADQPDPAIAVTGLAATPADTGCVASAQVGAEVPSSYTGSSGHLAVMAEFLHRGINVAVPVVDAGDDVFVVRHDEETVTRVQVKTANGDGDATAYSAQFSLPIAQLNRVEPPALVYVFTVRHLGRWLDFVVIRRTTLQQIRADFGVGSTFKKKEKEYLKLTLSFTANDVRNKEASFQKYRNAWEPWPPPQPQPEQEGALPDAPDAPAVGGTSEA
jgi:hypothetical protein